MITCIIGGVRCKIVLLVWSDVEVEKFKKMLLYMESVLAFLQYGDALEQEMADTGVVFKLWKDTLKFCQ